MSRTTEFIVHVNLKVILHVQCVRLKQNGGLMFGHCGDAVRLSREKMWMKRLRTIQPHPGLVPCLFMFPHNPSLVLIPLFSLKLSL